MLMIPDAIWNEIKNIIFDEMHSRGRPQSDPRLVLSGILYILKTGSQWHCLPAVYGKATTVHGRFRSWIKSKVFENIFQRSIDASIKIAGKPECFLIDTSFSKAPLSKFAGKNPTDRGRNGVKRSVIIDWNKTVLSIIVSAANKHDFNLLTPHIKKIKQFLNTRKVILSDSAWDSQKLKKELLEKNLVLISSTNIRRNKSRDRFYPKGRWKIEQFFGIQQWYRGIKTCWSKCENSFLALCQMASSIHNFKLAGIFG